MYRQSEKNLLSSNTSSTGPDNMVNFGPLTAETGSGVWGTPTNFNGFCVLAATNSRHTCWGHTMKVLGSRVTSVRRNSSSIVTFRYTYFGIMVWNHSLAVSVRRVSIRQAHWNTTSWHIRTTNSFVVFCVVNFLSIKTAWSITTTYVLTNWVLPIFLMQTFLANQGRASVH